LIATLATAAALCATSWSSYARTRDTTQTLIRGDGELLFESATQHLRALRRPPSKKQLQTLLDKLSDRGVRYLEFHGPFAVVTVGKRTYAARPGPPQPGPPGRPIVFRRIGSIVRIEVRQPRPLQVRQPRPPPPPGRFDGPHGPPPPDPPRAPPLVMEFEPIDANALVAGARRSFVFSVATGSAMLAAALVAFVLLLRRERAEERLAQERHLASLGAMSAVLAHELRNPLASLKGHAQLLAESLPEDEKPRAKADRVVTEAVRLERLTSDLLAFVRTGKIDCKLVDPVAPLRAAVDEAGNGDIEVDTAAAPERWSMDGDRIQQVLANLLRNAVQASPAGSSVHATVARDRHHLLYEVRDHGDGIPSGDERAIFEPFHTGRVKGTGLGLAVAKRVVELHGGSIDAHNHPEGGAVFRVRLPEGL